MNFHLSSHPIPTPKTREEFDALAKECIQLHEGQHFLMTNDAIPYDIWLYHVDLDALEHRIHTASDHRREWIKRADLAFSPAVKPIAMVAPMARKGRKENG